MESYSRFVQSARKITNTGTSKNINKFFSVKVSTQPICIVCESILEKDYMYLLEIDPDVVFFRGQYPQLKYTLDGKPHTYTPDVLIQRKSKDREQVVEVKSASKVSSEKNASLFQIVAPIYQKLGYGFLIITDELIQLQPKLNNIKLLHRYSRVSFTLQNFISCKKYFEDKGTTII